MKCRAITYGRTIDLGRFENFRLSMEVELQDGEKTEDVLNTLRSAVDSKCESIKAKLQNQQPKKPT